MTARYVERIYQRALKLDQGSAPLGNSIGVPHRWRRRSISGKRSGKFGNKRCSHGFGNPRGRNKAWLNWSSPKFVPPRSTAA